MPRYAVIQLIRDNELYFRTEFPAVYKAVQQAVQKPLWFFVENDSRDQTVALAQQYGHVLTVQAPKQTFLTSRCTMRTEKMAALRNEAWTWVQQFGQFDYVIWLDTHISLVPQTITRLFQCLQADETIGLACANTVQKGTKMHYYDTYALHAEQCLWAECSLCRGPSSHHDIVDVPSAFGGLCVLRGDIPCFFAATHNLCEHVYMCQKIRDRGFRIVIVGPARATWTP